MLLPSLNSQGRFGHQFHNFLAAFLISKFSGIDLIKTYFSGNSEAWNNYISLPGIDFNLDQRSVNTLQCTGETHITKEHLKFFYSFSKRQSNNSIIKIPIDLWAGEELLKILPHYKSDLLGMVKKPSTFSEKIAIHLRRGDVSSNNSLYTSNEHYLYTIDSINHKYPDTMPIYIYSEGSPTQFEELAKLLHQRTNRDVILRVSESNFSLNPCEDFFDMTSSRVLICSYSTYANCAIYFSQPGLDRYFIADERSYQYNDFYMLDILKRFDATSLLFLVT